MCETFFPSSLRNIDIILLTPIVTVLSKENRRKLANLKLSSDSHQLYPPTVFPSGRRLPPAGSITACETVEHSHHRNRLGERSMILLRGKSE